jgi:predicted nucleic-acid-binding Zn-ribbon protein
MKTVDPCLKCPRQTKLQRTPQDKKFCAYCVARQEILKQQSRYFDGYVFESDFAMGIYNRMQTWSGKVYHCPKCGGTDFEVQVEIHDPPKGSQCDFKLPPQPRCVFVCKVDGRRFYPEETLLEKKGIE